MKITRVEAIQIETPRYYGHISGHVLIKVDVDEAADIAQDCGISAMPTFQFYKHSERVSEFAGADPNRLKATIADLV